MATLTLVLLRVHRDTMCTIKFSKSLWKSKHLSAIAKTLPHAAYAAFIHGISHKWSYSGTSLFQPRLGPTKVAALVRWLDFREPA